MPCEKCVVCNIKFENDIPNFNHESPNEENVNKNLSFIYRKILRIFCSYFNLPQNETENDSGNSDYAENTNENGILFSFPFCSECRNLVAELCIFHEKFEAIQKLVQKTVAKITMKILNTENEQENSSTSYYSSQNENENEEEKENGNASKYRQKIIQNFSPRILLRKYQKQNSEPKQMQRKEINGLNLTTNSNGENLLIDEDRHDNENENDDQNETDKITKPGVESNQNDSVNSVSFPTPEKRSQNLMEKIRSMAKPGQKAPTAKTRVQSESFSNGFTTIGDKFVHNSGKWWAVKTDLGWKCNSCQKTFVGASGPRIHMEMQHVTGKFKCKTCPRSFMRESFLKAHRCDFGVQKLKPAVEISPGKFKCGKWEFVETKDGSFQCSTCSITVQLKSSMTLHISKKHEFIYLHCNICDRFLNTEEQFKRHLASHAEPEPKSKLASALVSTATEKMKHVKNYEIPIPTSNLNSKPQNKSSPAEMNSSSTSASENEEEEEEEEEDEAPVSSSFSAGFNRVSKTRAVCHIGNSSWSIKYTKFGWKCGNCPKVYKTRRDGQLHMQLWHIPGEFPCNSCPRSFVRQSLLRKHRCGFGAPKIQNNSTVEVSPGKFMYNGKWEFVKNSEGIFQCSVCSATRKTKNALSSHMKTNHDAPKSQCQVCGQIFATKPLCDRHVETHLSPKEEFKCEEIGCTATFSRKKFLRFHQRMKHKAPPLKPILEKKFPCEKEGCHKKFVSLIFLKRHLEFHEKCFNCAKSDCRERFATFEEMETHFKTHKLLNQAESDEDEEMEKNGQENETTTKTFTSSSAKNSIKMPKRRKKKQAESDSETETESEEEEEMEFSDEEKDKEAELTTEESNSESENDDYVLTQL